jgi:hypothetical protein
LPEVRVALKQIVPVVGTPANVAWPAAFETSVARTFVGEPVGVPGVMPVESVTEVPVMGTPEAVSRMTRVIELGLGVGVGVGFTVGFELPLLQAVSAAATIVYARMRFIQTSCISGVA